MTAAPTRVGARCADDVPASQEDGDALTAHVVRDIREIAATEWDSLLAPDDLQATHRFVTACQESDIERAEYRHVLIFRRRTLEAVATLSAFRVPLDVLATGPARHMIATVRRAVPNALRVPVVFCGLPVSFGTSCLRFAAGADVAAALSLLCEIAERFAAETRARVICFKEFTATEAGMLAGLTSHGFFRAPSLPSCRLELRWPDVDAYIAAMRAGYRRQVATTRAARGHGRLTIRVVGDVGAECGRLHALYDEVIERAEVKLETLTPMFLRRLHEHLPNETWAIVVEQDGIAVAMAVVLDAPTVSTWLLVGMDYSRSRETAAYHVVVLEVIAHAIARGSRALEMGQTSYALKGRLGAKSTSRDLYVRYRSAFGHRLLHAARRALFPLHSMPTRRVFRDE